VRGEWNRKDSESSLTLRIISRSGEGTDVAFLQLNTSKYSLLSPYTVSILTTHSIRWCEI